MLVFRPIGVVDNLLLRSSLLFYGRFHFISGVRMFNFLLPVFRIISAVFKSRAGLKTENLALRYQLCVL